MFGFPRAKRPEGGKFKKNLLKSVILQVKFKKNAEIVDTFKARKECFKSKFPIINQISLDTAEIKFQKDKTPIIQTALNSAHGYEFKTENGKQTVAITLDSFSYTIAGMDYSNFPEVMSNVKEVFFPIFREGTPLIFERIAIRKINLVEPEDQSISIKDLLQLTFKKQLVKNISCFPDFIASGVTNVRLENSDKRLNLVYGLICPKPKVKHVILDIDMFLINQNLRLDSLETKWKEINDEVFNIFNWCISKDLITDLSK